MHLAMRRHKSIAKIAMGRRLAVRLYWMWRNGREYSQSLEFGSVRGTARNQKWREEQPKFDWASRSLRREFELLIMVKVLIEEMFGSDSSRTERLQTSRDR